MSYVDQRTGIETAFMTDFPVLQPNVLITGENADVDNLPATNTSWVRMSLTIGETFRNCIGKKDLTTNGIFNVQVFTPLAIGAGQATKIIDDAITVLRDANINKVEFLNYETSFIGTESGWYYNLIRARYRAFD